MSNALAIAATTATLRALLAEMLDGIDVTTLTPDQAPQELHVGEPRVNLFLYQAATNAAWRNMDMPRQLKPGETGHPPLPLTLSYLLTAYSDKGEIPSQQALGRAMSVLHDHPLLDSAFIETATESEVEGSDLHEQIERIRITLQPEPLDELSKLWTALQAQYRTSAAYQVSVVLIESTRSSVTPLPVLKRGGEDRGARVLTGSQPALELARPVAKLPGVRLGEDLALVGKHLAGDTVQVVLHGPRDAGVFKPKELSKVTDEEIVIRLPAPDEPPGTDAPRATWPSGIYSAQVIVGSADEPDLPSNEVPFALSPRIVVSPLTAATPDVELTVTCTPMVWPGQRVALLVGNRQVPAAARTVKTDTLSFEIEGLEAGEYVVRLRVDGVDSLPVDLSGTTPKFADDQKVTLEDA